MSTINQRSREILRASLSPKLQVHGHVCVIPSLRSEKHWGRAFFLEQSYSETEVRKRVDVKEMYLVNVHRNDTADEKMLDTNQSLKCIDKRSN